jgi:5-methylcytosine-specific restriction protein B
MVEADVLNSIEAALETWDAEAAAASAVRADELRAAFIERFPLECWVDLPVESYGLGQEIDGGTVSWWLEWGTKEVASISGGSSRKHLIYRSNADGQWRWPKQYGSLDEAWTAVRGGFIESFQLAQEDRFEEIDDVAALRGAAAVRMKALYLYFPDRFTPVCSRTHINHFLRVLGQPAENWAVVAANRQLRRVLADVPGLATLTAHEQMLFLYHWAHPRAAVRVFKIAPGEQARHWADCLEGGYICVGWDEVGDLSQFDSKEEFREAFRSHFPHNGNEAQVSRKANEVWTLVELEAGDKVVANRGTAEVLAVGTVTDAGYQWRRDRPEFRHTVAVEWDTSKARHIEPVKAWATTTVKAVPAKLYETIIEGPPPPPPLDPVHASVEEAIARRGQVILYGPPGTGKTYTARRAATWLLSGGRSNAGGAALLADDERLAAEEERLSAGGPRVARLTRVTFHPSYTYEDFVEGFRPVAAGSGGGLQLQLVDGVFKQVCQTASKDPDRLHLLVIDEINRGNIPKIFGELITLIEKDKRGLTVHLPQSGDAFSVPRNLAIIGTMNTADRSIHLLDTALRRRFAFIELLPDPRPLEGATAGVLALDVFLESLNGLVRSRVGREKQIGHALFFQDGAPVETPEAFAAVFRHELLPLLQEYLYEDYEELHSLLGPIIDPAAQRPASVIEDPEALCTLLADHFNAHAAT